jgi:hypothetical protein
MHIATRNMHIALIFVQHGFLILNPSDLEEMDLNGHWSLNTSFVNKKHSACRRAV